MFLCSFQFIELKHRLFMNTEYDRGFCCGLPELRASGANRASIINTLWNIRQQRSKQVQILTGQILFYKQHIIVNYQYQYSYYIGSATGCRGGGGLAPQILGNSSKINHDVCTYLRNFGRKTSPHFILWQTICVHILYYIWYVRSILYTVQQYSIFIAIQYIYIYIHIQTYSFSQ